MAENPNALPSFVTALIAQIRAEDSYTGRQGFTDDVLIKPYLVTLDQRLRQQVIGDMTAALTARIRLFYQTAAIIFERHNGLLASVMYEMSQESFGRVLLYSGSLVLYTKTLRDANRFGFSSIANLEDEGQKIVTQTLTAFKKYPEVARN